MDIFFILNRGYIYLFIYLLILLIYLIYLMIDVTKNKSYRRFII